MRVADRRPQSEGQKANHMYAPQPATMAEMFPTRMRYSRVSLGSQVTSIVAGSLAPIIAVALLDRFDSAVPIAWYLAGACAVTAVAVLYKKETKGISIESIDIADAAMLEADRDRLEVGVK